MILNKPGLLRDTLKLFTQYFLVKFERFLIDWTAGLCVFFTKLKLQDKLLLQNILSQTLQFSVPHPSADCSVHKKRDSKKIHQLNANYSSDLLHTATHISAMWNSLFCTVHLDSEIFFTELDFREIQWEYIRNKTSTTVLHRLH